MLTQSKDAQCSHSPSCGKVYLTPILCMFITILNSHWSLHLIGKEEVGGLGDVSVCLSVFSTVEDNFQSKMCGYNSCSKLSTSGTAFYQIWAYTSLPCCGTTVSHGMFF